MPYMRCKADSDAILLLPSPLSAPLCLTPLCLWSAYVYPCSIAPVYLPYLPPLRLPYSPFKT